MRSFGSPGEWNSLEPARDSFPLLAELAEAHLLVTLQRPGAQWVRTQGTAMLPIFVINLDRRPDRMRSIVVNLDQLGLKAHRIPAVDSRTVTDEELNERVSLNGSSRSIELDRGAGACVFSHLQALDKFLSGSDALAALMLEDDAELAADVPALLESTGWWPAGAKIIRLENLHRHSRGLWRPSGKTPNGRDLRRLERWC